MFGERFTLSVLAIAGFALVVQRPATAGGGTPFTAAQAGRGAAAYRQNCASCHGTNLQGVSAPSLSGKLSPVAQQSVAEVYVYVSQQMPMTAPGSLTPAQYLSITAYILKQNGHRPTSLPLTVGAAKTSETVVGAR